MSDHRRRTTIEENVSESLLNSLPTLSQAPQVTFDLNLDNLRHFINEMSNTVNQHSKFLKTLYKDISLKLPSSDIHIILSSISNSIPLQFGGSASNLNTWHDGLNSTSSGLQGISSQISSLLGFKQEITNYCHNLAEKIETKASHDEVDKVLKKCKVLIDEKVSKDEMKAKFTEIEKTIKVTEDKLTVRINDLEKKFGDLEINTLWKLKDCEELLKVRVNEKFVWDAINSVEGRIKKDIFNESQGRIERLENQITTLEREMARNADENLRKDKEIKHKLQEINQEFSTKTGKHDHNQLVEVVKNLNLELEGLRHKQLGELEDKIKNIEKIMEKLKGDQYGLMIEELGIKLQKLEEKLIELWNRPIHQEMILVEKDDKNMYQRLLSEIEQLKYQLSQKIDKDMLAELHSSINKPSHPIQPIQDINELWKFRERALQNFKEIQDKFDKISKKLELKTLKKMIYMKADDEMVKNNLNSINQVLQDHEQAFSALQKHIEAMQKALAKIFSMLNELSVQSGSALISRKSWAPLNCLSCGRGDTGYLPPLPTIQGADGRMYQADTVTLKSNMSASMTELPKVELEPSYHEFQGSNVSPGLKDPLKGSLRAPLSVVIGKEAKVVFRSEKSKNRPQSARVNN